MGRSYEVLKFVNNAKKVEVADRILRLEADNERIGEIEEENARLKERNAKLVTLVSHLMYVKPRDVTAILHEGKLLRFDDLLEEVGLRWEDA